MDGKFSFYEITQSMNKRIKTKKRKMIALFSSVNNLTKSSFAVPFDIDYEIFRHADSFYWCGFSY